MPGNEINICGQIMEAPNGDEHCCYELLDHVGHHLCCDDKYGAWTDDGSWVVQDDPYDPFPLDGSFDISKVIFPQTTSGKVDDSWEDGLY